MLLKVEIYVKYIQKQYKHSLTVKNFKSIYIHVSKNEIL